MSDSHLKKADRSGDKPKTPAITRRKFLSYAGVLGASPFVGQLQKVQKKIVSQAKIDIQPAGLIFNVLRPDDLLCLDFEFINFKVLNLPEEIGWEEVPETSITLKPQSSGARESSWYVWKGCLKLPREIKVRDYRLTIREYEIFDTDELDRTKATVTAVPKKFKRLVYAETIKLADL